MRLVKFIILLSFYLNTNKTFKLPLRAWWCTSYQSNQTQSIHRLLMIN